MIKRKTRSLLHLIKNKELMKQLKWKYYINTNHNPKNTLFVSGMGRSGTTWLSQILNHNNRYRYIFEPFYPERLDLCSFFAKRQYLRPIGNYPLYLNTAEKIVSGKIRSHFLDRYNEKFLSGKRMIKDVQTNLLLGWINQNFRKTKILLTIRHPCAIANSWIKLGWEPLNDVYLEQQELVEDYLEEFEKDIRKADTKYEKLVYMWCIEYYVPLQQRRKNLLDMKQISYEDLCENFEQTIRGIYEYIGEKHSPSLYEMKDKPSYTTRPFAAILQKTNLLYSWKESLTKEQIQQAKDITSQFNLEKLYEFQ